MWFKYISLSRFIFIFFLVITVSCSKDPATFHLENLNNNEIGCFGHAGMGFYSAYPVNSWPGFASCLNRGADGTEMDIHMTKDSVLVITHSSNLQETTACSGAIKDLNWDDMNNCEVQSNFFKNSKLLSLEEFIEKIPHPKNYTFTWDIKLSDFNTEYYGVYARAIINTINKYDLNEHVFIENPFADFLQVIKDKKSNTHLFILAEDFEEGLQQVKQAHNNNIRVTIYGVLSEKENYAAVEKCPDFMQTDDINYLLKIFQKYNKGKGFLYDVTK
jgi:glycerophosphoryl diester phosphodiesterase